ncbi:FAD dependent oxidoreductase-domain-containing protein [Aspergillus heterothallicus]
MAAQPTITTTMLSNADWASQDFDERIYARAPNPAEFPETPETSKSYWIREFKIDFEDECTRAPFPTEVDTVIIGSGITGATVAYQISHAQPGLRVAMVEARGLCTGATGRNGGHIGRPEVYHLRELAAHFGPEEAIKLRQLGLRNGKMMLEALTELGAIEQTDTRLNGTIVVFETAEEREEFAADLEFARQQGHRPVGYLIEAPEVLSKVNIERSKAQHGAAYIERSGTIYPRKFVAALLRDALKRMSGLTIHAYTPVSSVASDFSAEKYHYTVSTNRGAIKARAVFHATNGYASHLISALTGPTGVYGGKGHMLAVQPNRAAPEECQLQPGFGYQDFWHWVLQRPNSGPYLYGLASAEELGQYNDNITLPDDNENRRKMIKFLETVFPHHFREIDVKRDVIYDWTGVQGFTHNSASIVGRPNPGSPGEYASVGHNGEGMGRCFVSATVATDALLNYLNGVKDWTPPEWFPEAFARNLGTGDV